MMRSGLLCLLLAGCQVGFAAAKAEMAEPVMTPAEGFYMGGERARAALDDAEAAPHSTEVTNQPAAEPRMMIRRGTLGIAVARTDEAIARFLSQVEGWGGYLAQRTDATVTCRIPAPRFDEAVAALRVYGRVVRESIEAQDVTKEHLDLGIRLDNAKRARERLLALLEKATEVKDVLEIENALRRLTEEIERMEGEIKFLADQVAMATLTAAFQTVAPSGGRARPPASRFPWINRVGVEHVRRAF